MGVVAVSLLLVEPGVGAQPVIEMEADRPMERLAIHPVMPSLFRVFWLALSS